MSTWHKLESERGENLNWENASIRPGCKQACKPFLKWWLIEEGPAHCDGAISAGLDQKQSDANFFIDGLFKSFKKKTFFHCWEENKLCICYLSFDCDGNIGKFLIYYTNQVRIKLWLKFSGLQKC